MVNLDETELFAGMEYGVYLTFPDHRTADANVFSRFDYFLCVI